MKKRESIITSVVAISRKQGIDALSIRDISDNSKVAVGTVYHYFSDKEDLLSQTMDYVLSKRKIALGKNDSKKDSTEERLDRFWTNLFNYYVNYPDELYFISHYSLLSDLPSSEQNLKPLLKTIERGIAQGDLRYIYPKVMLEVFLSHVASCARMHIQGEATIGETQVGFIRQTCWDSLKSIE